MSGGHRQFSAFLMVALIGLLVASTASAHEQETYNVIVVADGPMPANITDSDFVQGNAVVFRMKDTTENASIRITLDTDLNGAFDNQSDNRSDWLVYACELTDNGTLVDEDCSVSYTYEFATNATPGTYAYQLEWSINETVTAVENYSILLWKDVHEEPGVPTLGDCFGIGCDVQDAVEEGDDQSRDLMLIAVAAGAAIGAIGLAISIRNDAKLASKVLVEEE